MRKVMTMILAVFFVAVVFIGCREENVTKADDPVTLTMWHNYGGEMQQTMDYLIDQFNSTVGKEQGIVINVTAISSGAELNKSLGMIVDGEPGAPEMPDIFTGYPKLAVQFMEKGMLANLDDYFTKEELSAYVEEFVEEGRLSDGGLYVFPLAKSTEILYLNRTKFDEFAKETGADISKLETVEGLAKTAALYYEWTDSLTPDVENDGKWFFTADSWFNVAEVGMEQLGSSVFDENGRIDLSGEEYEYIFHTLYDAVVKGGFAVYDGYSSDLSKTGDILCSTGSSAGILFYGDTITHEDGTVEQVNYDILPYPVFENGEKIALQRGGGLMIAKTDERKEYAACVFLKWLTAPEQNMKFISETGYLPVTDKAFTVDIKEHMETLEDERIKMMLTAVLSMYDEYEFFYAPNFSTLEEDSDSYETAFKDVLREYLEKQGEGQSVTPEEALVAFQG